MQTENLTYNDVVVKTIEAMVVSGLKNTTVHGSYSKYYGMLGKYLDQRGIHHYDHDAIEEYLEIQEKRYRKKEIHKRHYCGIKRAVRILVEYANGDMMVIPKIKHITRFPLNNTFEEIISDYLDHNTFHPNTRDDIVWALRRFMHYFEQLGHTTLHCIEERHIRQFLLSMSETLSPGSLKNIMCYLKAFMVYAFDHGYMFWNASALFDVKIRRENKIYPVISDHELERTLAQINTKSLVGKRDMAMILLGVSNGMRAADIVNLKLHDIDWLNGELHLVQNKTANPVVLPLMRNVGEALKDYILNARPDISSEYVFLTTRFPIRKLSEGTSLAFIFEKYEEMAGIERKPFDGKGFHSLRRRIATKMVIAGVPVTTVSQVLGQMKMDSAKQYLSFNTENLRECAISLDGIEIDGGVFGD